MASVCSAKHEGATRANPVCAPLLSAFDSGHTTVTQKYLPPGLVCVHVYTSGPGVGMCVCVYLWA